MNEKKLKAKLFAIELLYMYWLDSDKSKKITENIMNSIYTIAHCRATCPHPEWEDRAEKVIKKFKGMLH